MAQNKEANGEGSDARVVGLDPSPAERLRALELSGDPDAIRIAREYATIPLNPAQGLARGMVRSYRRIASSLTQPTYAQASLADAAEAESRYANIRAKREKATREREQQL